MRFETSKTEAVLFSKKGPIAAATARSGWETRRTALRPRPPVERANGSTPPSRLPRTDGAASQRPDKAEARLSRIVTKYGVLPAAGRGLQAAIVQGTMLYAVELTWNG